MGVCIQGLGYNLNHNVPENFDNMLQVLGRIVSIIGVFGGQNRCFSAAVDSQLYHLLTPYPS